MFNNDRTFEIMVISSLNAPVIIEMPGVKGDWINTNFSRIRFLRILATMDRYEKNVSKE